MRYTTQCCDMIAVKREVAACGQVFPWSECLVIKTDDKSLYKFRNPARPVRQALCLLQAGRGGCEGVGRFMTHPEMCTVAACRTDRIVRIGGDFFYDKSGNENHS